MQRTNKIIALVVFFLFASAGVIFVIQSRISNQTTGRLPSDLRRISGGTLGSDEVEPPRPLLDFDYPQNTRRGEDGDRVKLKLTVNVPAGHKFSGGEIFTARIFASPWVADQPNNMLHIEEIRFPIKYDPEYLTIALVTPSVTQGEGGSQPLLRLDQTGLDPACTEFYENIEPFDFYWDDANAFGSFYMHMKFRRTGNYALPENKNKGIQLWQDQCIAEVKFQVKRITEGVGAVPSGVMGSYVEIPNVARAIGVQGRGPDDATGNIQINQHTAPYGWLLQNPLNEVLGTFALGHHLRAQQGVNPTTDWVTATNTPTDTPTRPPTLPPTNTLTPTPTVRVDSFTWNEILNTNTHWYRLKKIGNTLYAVGGSNWNDALDTSAIVVKKLTDGGTTWTDVSPQNISGWARGFDCKDASECWLAQGGDNGQILHTMDGGTAWTEVNRPANYSNNLWSAQYMSTGTDERIVIGTDTSPKDGSSDYIFLQSLNGGDFAPDSILGNSHTAYDFSCPTAEKCYSVAQGLLYITENGGENWSTRIPTTQDYFGMDCASDEQRCVLVGDMLSVENRTGIETTIYDGETFNSINNFVPQTLRNTNTARLYDVDMNDDMSKGYAVGCKIKAGNEYGCISGALLLAQTGTRNWGEVATPEGAPPLMDIYRVDDNILIVAGFNGKIWRLVKDTTALYQPNPVQNRTVVARVSQTAASAVLGVKTTRANYLAQLVPLSQTVTPTPYYVDRPENVPNWPLLYVEPESATSMRYNVSIDYDKPQVNDDAPDLVVSDVSLYSDPQAEQQCDIQLQVKIKNIGKTAITPITGFHLMANGERIEIRESIKPGAELPPYFFRTYMHGTMMGPNVVQVDSSQNIPELREDNNIVRRFLFIGSLALTKPACGYIPLPTYPPSGVPLTPGDNPTGLPEIPLDMTKVNVKIKAKLQGINNDTFSKQYLHVPFSVAIGGGTLSDPTEYVKSDFVYTGGGTYEGVATFDPEVVVPGNNYKLLVKGPRHIAKRFCSSTASGNTYFCPSNAGAIPLNIGLTSFDFSTVPLAPGDTAMGGSQDGVVDSSDLTYIRDNLSKKDAEILKAADLNFDGIIDTQDFSLVINNLINNEDER